MRSQTGSHEYLNWKILTTKCTKLFQVFSQINFFLSWISSSWSFLCFLSSSTHCIMITKVMLTHPPARISANSGMVSSSEVNLSLTKSFIWKKREEDIKKKRQMRHNPNLDSRALMLTCGCSHILIVKSALSLRTMHGFHSQWITHSNFLNTLSHTVEWLAVSLIAFSGATPMSCGRRPAKYYS